MPKLGVNTGNAGKGRPKGSKNKTTVAVKEALALAAEGIGGTERLIAWVKENPDNERIFWSQMYTKLLPHQVEGPDGGPLQVSIVRYADSPNS